MLLRCDALTAAGFVHAFGTRRCGWSAEPSQQKVSLDRFRDLASGSDWEFVVAKQTHSDICLLIDEKPVLEGDALISSQSHRLVGIKTADCVPLLIGDPITGRYAAVHAGWRGTANRITEKTIDRMRQLGSAPSDLIAAIGPAACGDCYEVDGDVADLFESEALVELGGGKFRLDTRAANCAQLISAGLRPDNIHLLSQCTMHENDIFFSHRQESKQNPALGRNLSAIGRR